ncbi:PEBP-like protein [Mycena vitilis]|nr:PEBP-like protein [Mycena vitilis]
MQLSRIVGLSTLFALVARQDTSLRAVNAAFSAANISATLGITFDPKALLEVSFPQAHGRPVTLHAGIQLPINTTARPPSFEVRGAAGRGPFVVAMVDPDAPTPADPSLAQIRHFLAGDFHLRDDCLFNTTPAVSDFVQPAPPAGSPAHRYIILLYKQSAAFAHQQLVNASTSVLGFNLSQFASAVGLGEPVAGTFMLVAPELSQEI